MLLFHGTTPTPCSTICLNDVQTQLLTKRAVTLSSTPPTAGQKFGAVLAAAGATALVLSAGAIEVAAPQEPEETLSNIPQSLSSVCAPGQQDCKKRYKIQRPKSRKAESCTSKCTATCMQGGFGSPGDGPFSMRSIEKAVEMVHLNLERQVLWQFIANVLLKTAKMIYVAEEWERCQCTKLMLLLVRFREVVTLFFTFTNPKLTIA
ncbi:UNVERIFIED_CONTAM: hypothetical protein Sradi_2133900 [Sesamum radiatum]|uniref:Uncharacterized protein n=1 Tax=Sesamum radiatum TaxID=300843 RepID=A0AAW2TJK6_SESRA